MMPSINGTGSIASIAVTPHMLVEPEPCVPEFSGSSASPVLVVRLPGSQPLTIGCQERNLADGFLTRFSWRGKVPIRVNAPADYSVSSADWLMLVGEFGLAPACPT